MCYFPHHYWQEKDCYQEKQALLGWTSRKCCKNGQNQQIEQSIHHQCLYCKPSEKPQASFKPGSEEKNWIKIIIRKANASSKPSGGLCLCFLKATDLFFHQWTIISRRFYWWGASFGIHLAIAEWVVQLHGDNTIKFHFPLVPLPFVLKPNTGQQRRIFVFICPFKKPQTQQTNPQTRQI